MFDAAATSQSVLLLSNCCLFMIIWQIKQVSGSLSVCLSPWHSICEDDGSNLNGFSSVWMFTQRPLGGVKRHTCSTVRWQVIMMGFQMFNRHRHWLYPEILRINTILLFKFVACAIDSLTKSWSLRDVDQNAEMFAQDTNPPLWFPTERLTFDTCRWNVFCYIAGDVCFLYPHIPLLHMILRFF